MLDLSHNSLAPGVAAQLPALAPGLTALSLGQQETAAVGEDEAELAALAELRHLRLLVISAGHYSASYLPTGLRSPAETAHIGRVQAALPAAVRVTNSQAEFERCVGRLQSLFDVQLKQ